MYYKAKSLKQVLKSFCFSDREVCILFCHFFVKRISKPELDNHTQQVHSGNILVERQGAILRLTHIL